MKEHTELPGEVGRDVLGLEVALEPPPTSRDGKWTCSTHAEHWNCDEEFETKEEARAYLLSEHAPQYGADDGDRVFVGQIRLIAPSDLAAHGASAWSVIESLQEHLYELVGEAAEDSIDCSNEDEDDLDRRLAATIQQWMIDRKIAPSCWSIENIETITWQQCEAKHDANDNPRGRCLLHLEHQGEHEWP